MALSAILAASCSSLDLPYPDSGHGKNGGRVEFSNPRYKRVMIYYGEAYNNLAAEVTKNLSELESGYVPAKTDHEVILCYVHTSRNRTDWTTPTEPVIFRMFRQNGQVIRDTLMRFDADRISVRPEMVNEVLRTVRQKFPSSSYGMVFSSHSTGWLPKDYEPGSENIFGYSAAPSSIGAQYDKNRQEHTLDVQEFADALPMKLDYILFDCCLMGGIETTYMLRNKADYIIASPTEVLSEGFNYKTLGKRLLGEESPDLAGVCEDYYRKQSGGFGATVGLYDCARADAVANLCADIFAAHDNILSVDYNKVQSYNYSFEYHYDFRDIITNMGATEEELARLDDILGQFVLCKYATRNFISVPINPETFSGISMYLPKAYLPVLNSRYQETEWNKKTGLLK